jgi:hypothetical protein
MIQWIKTPYFQMKSIRSPHGHAAGNMHLSLILWSFGLTIPPTVSEKITVPDETLNCINQHATH